LEKVVELLFVSFAKPCAWSEFFDDLFNVEALGSLIHQAAVALHKCLGQIWRKLLLKGLL
jgi:hypothetical protein